MDMTKRILILALAAGMVLPGCGGTSQTETQPAAIAAEETAAETETELKPELPEITFDGAEFRMMYRYGAHAYNISDMWVENLNGEIINDSVYNRNLHVEDTFNVTLVPLEEASPVSKVKKSVQAGDDFCEILADRMFELFPVTLEGYMYNWQDLRYVNTDMPWWDSNAAAELTLGDQLYMMIGDFSLSASCGAQMLWFNKALLTDYGFDMPYPMVYDGTWTVDRMLEMVNTVAEDLNGDGNMDINDRFGMLTQVPYRMTTGFGIQFTQRDEGNYPVLAPLTEQMVDAMAIVTALMNDTQHTITYLSMSAGQDTSGFPHLYAFCRSKFTTDQILFMECSISAAAELVEMESPYGILAMPKMDESQERYYHLTDEYSCGWVMPASIVSLEMTDVLLEYLAYASGSLVDAVYETTLKRKRMDAPDDAAMLDLVRETTWYEITFIAGAGIREMLEAAVKSGNLASEYAKKESAITAKLDACRAD